MAFRCSRCNGSVIFDVDSQRMKCAHCDSVFLPEEFQVRDSGTQSDAGLSSFVCGNCGATLESTEESVIGYCPYCGGQSMLHTPMEQAFTPERLIPFQVTRQRCAELYGAYAKKIRYLPGKLKNPEFLQSFTGIYMPFYSYDVRFGASDIQGTKTVERRAKYDTVNTYQINMSLSGGYSGAYFDASRYLDDEIAARALPFDRDRERPYHPAYLSGFYADTSTVAAELYYEDAHKQASREVLEAVAADQRQKNGVRVDTERSTLEAETTGHHALFLPMWFLTWRRGKRVAYAVVNGESGKVVSDLPIDLLRFALGCVVIAAVLFLVLELLFQPTPLVTSVFSLAAACFMTRSIRHSTEQVFEKQNHVNDKGWWAAEVLSSEAKAVPGVHESGLKNEGETSSARFRLLWRVLCVVIVLIYIQLNPFPAATRAISLRTPPLLILLAVAVLGYTLFTVRKVWNWQKGITERYPLVSILLVLLAVLLNVAVILVAPVNDGWYYLGDAVCIVVLVLATVAMMRLYNIGTTHPLPKLFERNEVS